MLPKIISNITLAVIAIFLIYTLFPVIQETIFKFFGIKNNKKNSKEQFDEMIERKKEILSKGNLSSSTTVSKETTKTRDEMDYLYENHYFKSDIDFNYIMSLKKELSWGSGESINEIASVIESHIFSKVDASIISLFLKQYLSKKYLIQQFPEKGISKEKFIDTISTNIICEKFDSINFEILIKKLNIQKSSLKTLFALVIAKEQKQEIEIIIEEHIQQKTLSLDLIKSINIKEFINKIKGSLDIIIPIEVPSENTLAPIGNNDLNTKRLKKMLALYHPDKWIYCKKTEIIDKRLRENFDIIQNLYTKEKQNG